MYQAKEEETDSYLQNRELSWLIFNGRVLEEAEDESIPLWERLRFLEIFTHNLDEFFMVRIGRLMNEKRKNKGACDSLTGLTVQEQLQRIRDDVLLLLKRRDDVYLNLEQQLGFRGIIHCSIPQLPPSDRKWLFDYLKKNVAPLLSLQSVFLESEFPYLSNQTSFLALSFERNGQTDFQICPLTQSLPLVVFLPGEEIRYCRMEECLLWWVEETFAGYKDLTKGIFLLTRNADLPTCRREYPKGVDPRLWMKQALQQRNRLESVRLQAEGNPSESLIVFLCNKLSLQRDQFFAVHSPLRYSYLKELQRVIPRLLLDQLKYPAFLPQPSVNVSLKNEILPQVIEQDILLHYPYESMEPFLQLIREAALDASVCSIHITLYRVADSSRLLQYLMMAAERNKEVVVFIELRARFDEENNLRVSEELENSGCRVIYPTKTEKLHAKLCLITRRKGDSVRYITQIGTGNYHEETAKQYIDFCLLTAQQEIGIDVARFFATLEKGDYTNHYSTLWVSPTEMRAHLLQAIDRQIDKGKEGRLLFQINSLSDREMIEKLVEAAKAGVEVRLIVRGICCLLPGVPNQTDGIQITSIVGRFLEHTRIYSFGRSLDSMELYFGSADLMSRNLDRRIEVLAPVFSKRLRERIMNLLALRCYDGWKARQRTANGGMVRPVLWGPAALDSQGICQALAKKATEKQKTDPSQNRDRSGEWRGKVY